MISQEKLDHIRRLVATRGAVAREVLTAMITATIGPDLPQLLAAFDDLGNHRDLEWLVYTYLNSRQRTTVLGHIAEQSSSWTPAIRVVSDVDDTVIASINDRSHPTGELYPGVITFLTQLGDDPGITFLTARLQGRFGVMEDLLRQQLLALGLPTATVLTGRIGFIATRRAQARRKAINLGHLLALHPNERVILVGDTVQGDVILANYALKTWPDRMVAVFIHLVGELKDRPAAGIVCFKDYEQAWQQAEERGLLQRLRH